MKSSRPRATIVWRVKQKCIQILQKNIPLDIWNESFIWIMSTKFSNFWRKLVCCAIENCGCKLKKKISLYFSSYFEQEDSSCVVKTAFSMSGDIVRKKNLKGTHMFFFRTAAKIISVALSKQPTKCPEEKFRKSSSTEPNFSGRKLWETFENSHKIE